MKKLSGVLVFIFIVAYSFAVSASGVHFGGEVLISAQEISRGDLVLFGGRTEVFGELRGNLISFGSEVVIDGQVSGDLVVFGSDVFLKASSIIDGNVINIGSEINREQGATVLGSFQNITSAFQFSIFKRPWLGFDIFGWVFSFFFSLLVGLIASYFFTDNVVNVKAKIESDWGAVLLWGFAALFLFIPLIVLLAITIVGIPLILLLIIAYWLGVLLGQVAIYSIFGHWLKTLFRKEKMQLMVSVIVGIAALFFFRAFLRMIPFLGTPISMIVTALIYLTALGGALKTRFGTNKPWLRKNRNEGEAV